MNRILYVGPGIISENWASGGTGGSVTLF